MEESGYAGFIMLIEVYFKNKVRDWVGSTCDYGCERNGVKDKHLSAQLRG